MRSVLIFASLVAMFAVARAEVVYEIAPIKVTGAGRLEVTSGLRNKVRIYRLTRIDRGNRGTFSDYIEDFFVDGVIVLRLSQLKGDRMVDCRNLGSGVVTFYYRGKESRPDRIVVGKSESSSEIYQPDEHGFYRAVADEDRTKLLGELSTIPDPIQTKAPNQLPDPTPTSVTPAAGQPARQP